MARLSIERDAAADDADARPAATIDRAPARRQGMAARGARSARRARSHRWRRDRRCPPCCGRRDARQGSGPALRRAIAGGEDAVGRGDREEARGARYSAGYCARGDRPSRRVRVPRRCLARRAARAWDAGARLRATAGGAKAACPRVARARSPRRRSTRHTEGGTRPSSRARRSAAEALRTRPPAGARSHFSPAAASRRRLAWKAVRTADDER